MDVIKELGEEIPIMGVCMGLQCMAQVFGGKATVEISFLLR